MSKDAEQKLLIDPEFRDLIPPLLPEEAAGLERELIAENGPRDALVVWEQPDAAAILLDGHHRLEICTRLKLRFRTTAVELPSRTAAKAWIIRNQFARRNLSDFTRVELALALKPLLAELGKANMAAGGGDRKSEKQKPGSSNLTNPIDTRAELARLAGVSVGTLHAAEKVSALADEETKARLRRNEISIHRAAHDVKEKASKEKRQDERQEAARHAPKNERIIVGDFRTHAGKVADGSVSLIFTDPPYDRKALELYEALGDFAAAKLAEGGSLLCYSGQILLPSIMAALQPKLRYWWTVCGLHSGGATTMREYGISNLWKPVLWFVKGTRDDKCRMVDDVMSGGREKAQHDWQQAESEAAYWIDALCPPDGLVVDPFLGSGTTGAAAKSLGRDWLGFEIDKDTARIASKRVGA